jgi:NitT/TauT family transport system substrate-binding protein
MINRRHFLAASTIAATTSLPSAPLFAQTPAATKLKFTLDWARQGPNAYVDMGKEKGFFKDLGIDITIDRGFGSGRVPTDIAAGTYDMGQGDIGPVIKFMAQNPDSDLVAIAIWGDKSLMGVTVRTDGNIKAPKDFEGKTLAAPETDGGRQLFPAFAKANNLDMSKINWMTVTSDLREPMLLQKRADGITGAVTSTSMSLKNIGLDVPQQRIMMYRDFGVELYGYCFLTSRKFLAANPQLARNALKGLFKSLIYANNNRAESIAALKKIEPLTDVAIETERQAISYDQMVISDYVKKNGLSVIDPARLQKALRTIEDAYGLPPKLTPERVYTDAFLPPIAERRI